MTVGLWVRLQREAERRGGWQLEWVPAEPANGVRVAAVAIRRGKQIAHIGGSNEQDVCVALARHLHSKHDWPDFAPRREDGEDDLPGR